MEDNRVKIYVVYLDGKPLSRDTGRKVAYLEPSGARATVTVLARQYVIEKSRFEIRIFTDSDEVIC